MARFPVYVDLTDQRVVVIGGGRTACRKVNTLIKFDARIEVICASSCNELKEMADKGIISLFDMQFDEESISKIEGAFMVICASDDHDLNRKTAEYCRRQQIWVDCVDSAQLSTFVFPSVVKRENIVVGISTSGEAPVLARHLRRKIEETVPEWYGELEHELADRREKLKKSELTDAEKKRELLKMIEKAEDMRAYDRRNQEK